MRIGMVIISLILIMSCKQDGDGQISFANKESHVKYTKALFSSTKEMQGEIYQFKYSINGEKSDRNTFYEYLDKDDFVFGRNDMKLLRQNKNDDLMIREHDLKGYTINYLRSNSFEPQSLDVKVDHQANTLFLSFKALETGEMRAYVYDIEKGLPVTASPFYQDHFSGNYEMTVFIRDKMAQNYRLVIMVGDKICIREYQKGML